MPSKQDLPQCFVPMELRLALSKKQNRRIGKRDANSNKFSVVLNKLKKIDRLLLSEAHYFEFLKLSLHLEQHQQVLDMKKFSLVSTTLHQIIDNANGNVLNKFRINITNMCEDDPILNVSDSLRVYDTDKKKHFYLKVASLQKNYVVAIANKKFCREYTDTKKYNVDLVFNDHTFRQCHSTLAIANTKSIKSYIFPCKNGQFLSILEEVNNNQRSWFNKKISKNPEQKQAVLNICAKSSFPAPYVLYGPPGTGKTATVVEAVCQIWQDSEEHILICAPSNAACDVVTMRLLKFIKPHNLFRMYSQGKDFSTIPKQIAKCCNYNYDGFADKFDEKSIISKRIIITTLSSSTKLKTKNSKLKFSHIFIDEAGQATQPDALLPVVLIKNFTQSTNCQIVISGDPQQLGPCVRSKLAESILGESMLEKLMRHKPYEKSSSTGYDPHYITKLIHNYRSSSEIIHVSNKLFYDNELIANSNKKVDRFPIIFHAVEGTEEKAGSSNSSYNQKEIKKVLHYVNYFVKTKIGDKRFGLKDIGVVTPFTLQSLRLRKELEKKNMSAVDVGTVEVFQGREKEIIIMTTVRSKTFHHDDKGEHIGFLSNPRRFNVALTRPKTFLVVVGNPNVLQVDHCWKYFLKFCQENKACRGDAFTLKEDVDELLQRLNLGIRSKRSDQLFNQHLKLFY